MTPSIRAFVPDLVFSNGKTISGVAVVVRDGVIASIGSPPEGAEVIRLPRTAIVPGLVSAHSHAFQRAIRGQTEYRSHPVDDFWTWREAMYAAAEQLSLDDLE